ncbi:hypothetical protein ACSBR1_021287 [Camellia fascicularis]
MAIAGLQTVPVLDSSFNRESRSPLSRRWGNHDRLSTRTSSLLQMWRTLEGEHVMSHSQLRVGDRLLQQRIHVSNADLENAHLSERQDGDDEDSLGDGNEIANECQTWSQGQIRLQNEQENGNSSSSEQSTDFGEVERERVRQIFREWMNTGVRGQVSDVSHVNSSRAQCLGENECERVRVIREWTQMTSQQRDTCGSSREEQAAHIGAQIERVRDGLVVNHSEIGARRNIRQLCGRQALLDLLARAERERQRELQGLLEHRPVSDFAHRNRIQSLLRGRFLQSGRLVQDERPSSVAASELGLLRQRQSVSGLREGFLSRLDNFIPGPAITSQSDTTSYNDINDYRNEQTQTNSSFEDRDAIQEQSEPCNGERDIDELCTVPLNSDASEDINWQEPNAQEEQQAHDFENEEREGQPSFNPESIGRRDSVMENACRNWEGNSTNEQLQGTSGNESEEQGCQQEAHEVFHERYEPSGEECDVHGSTIYADGYENNTTEGIQQRSHTFPGQGEWQESITDTEDSDWQQLDNAEFSGWRDDTAEGTDGNWRESDVNHWYQETSGSEGDEHQHLQQLHEEWHDNGQQDDAMDNLLEGSSALEADPVGRFDTFSFPDDDNVYSTEIRELLSRRSVSNLLQSDFRESLNQLIQSYAERQAHASVDWEVDGMLPSPLSPALMEQDVQQSVNQNQDWPDALERTPFVLPPPPVIPSHPFWGPELHGDNWPQNNLHQRLGIEWEIINDLRIDMARLQQRMNNMQRMLEACMDMQLELQRAVRQEVSAALNRSACSTGLSTPLTQLGFCMFFFKIYL